MTFDPIMSKKMDTGGLGLPNEAPVNDSEMPRAEDHAAAKPQSSDSNILPSKVTEESNERKGHIWEQSLDQYGQSVFVRRSGRNVAKSQEVTPSSEHEPDSSSREASATIKTPEFTFNDDQEAEERQPNEPVPKNEMDKNVNTGESAKGSVTDDDVNFEATKEADINEDLGDASLPEASVTASADLENMEDTSNPAMPYAYNRDGESELEEASTRSMSRSINSDEESEAKPLNLDTTGFMPSAENNYQFVYDSPSGRRAKELNDLFELPTRAKNFPTDLAGQKANISMSYRFLGSLPKRGHVRDMVARMEQGMKKVEEQVEKDMAEEEQVEKDMAEED